jgi:hypothetical protein
VEQESKEKENASKNVGSSNDPSHRLAVNWVHREQHRRNKNATCLAAKDMNANTQEEKGRHDMQKDVHEMISKRI